jgi:hypothetical protein
MHFNRSWMATKSLKIPKEQSESEIIEGQITQWPNEIGQGDKQRSTKHYKKTKDRAKRTWLNPSSFMGPVE